MNVLAWLISSEVRELRDRVVLLEADKRRLVDRIFYADQTIRVLDKTLKSTTATFRATDDAYQAQKERADIAEQLLAVINPEVK